MNIRSAVNIRPYVADDYRAVKAVLMNAGLYDQHLDTAGKLSKKISLDSRSILVAESETGLVGVVYINFDGWKALISRLAVTTEERGKGLGHDLLTAAEQELKSRGADTVFLQFRSEKPGLIKFYNREGYQVEATVNVLSKELK